MNKEKIQLLDRRNSLIEELEKIVHKEVVVDKNWVNRLVNLAKKLQKTISQLHKLPEE